MTTAIPAFSQMQTAGFSHVALLMKLTTYSLNAYQKLKLMNLLGMKAGILLHTIETPFEIDLNCKSTVSSPAHELAASACDV